MPARPPGVRRAGVERGGPVAAACLLAAAALAGCGWPGEVRAGAALPPPGAGVVTAAAPGARPAAGEAAGFAAASEDPDRSLPLELRRAKRRANRRAARLRPRRARAQAAGAPSPSIGVVGGLNADGTDGAQPNTGGSHSAGDTTGAVGPHDYVEFNNARIAVYDRATLGLVAAESNEAFGVPDDEQIQWDPAAGRWFYLALGGGLAWGFSKTADPRDLANGWCHYNLAAPVGADLNAQDDYPKLGHSRDFLIFTSNVLTSTDIETARIWAVSKPPPGPLSTCPGAGSFTTGFWGTYDHPLLTADGSKAYTAIPANGADDAPAGYVVAAALLEDDARHVMVWRVVRAPSGAPDLQAVGEVAVGSFSSPPDVPQPDGSHLDTLPGFLTQAVAVRDPGAGAEAVWTQHTVAGASGRSVVRWYELLPDSLTLRQRGEVADPTGYVFNAAISPTMAGDEAVIHYNVADATHDPDLRARARRGGMPPGEMGGEITLATSPYTQEGDARWGDYVGASPDPADAHAVWGTGERVAAPPGQNTAQWMSRDFELRPLDQPPVAAFAVSPSQPVAGQPVTLTSTSTDPDGAIAQTGWDLTQSGTYADASGAAVTRTWAHSGSYPVALRVADDDGVQATVTRTIAVADAPPTADFGFAPAAPASGDAVRFTAAAADPDGRVAAVDWDLGSGSFGDAQGATASRAFARPGRYTVRLRVTDDEGVATVASHVVSVANRPPAAALAVAPADPVAGRTVTLDASGSADPDGRIAGYRWDLDGDGSYETDTGASAVATTAFARAGTFTVGVRVADDGGATATAARAVSVAGAPLEAPAVGSAFPPAAPSLALRAPRRTTASALRRGLRVRARCSRACGVTVTVLAGATRLAEGRRRLPADRWCALRVRAVRGLPRGPIAATLVAVARAGGVAAPPVDRPLAVARVGSRRTG